MTGSQRGSGRPRVVTVVGNRPQFIKAAAVSPALRASCTEVMIHTGQHYDRELSEVFFSELGLPRPDCELGVSLGSNTSQVARMLSALETVVAAASPDLVLVYGDTNSTLAGALVGAQSGLPVAHVEAGMRSFDREMPEEVNRVLTDHVSSLLLCSSEVALENLRREGIDGNAQLVGDVMVDVAMILQPRARERADLVRARGLTPGGYVLATAHRPANVDHPERLELLVRLLTALPGPVMLVVHPRTRRRLVEAGLAEPLGRRVLMTDSLGYVEFAALMCNARAVVTDSGGLQKEAYLAGVPCITLRAMTEWPETVNAGWNAVVDLDPEAARAALERTPPSERPPLYGDGQASSRVVAAVRAYLDSRSMRAAAR